MVDHGALADKLATLEPRRSLKSRSIWVDARIRFFKNRMAVFSVLILSLIVLFAVFGGLFARYTNEEIDWGILGNIKELGAPSIENGHYFGVDELGRDLYARVVQGSRISLGVAFLSTSIAVFVGTLLGALAGYFSGWPDNIIMRLVDILIAIPYMIFLIVVLAVFGRSIPNLFVTIGLISWMGTTLVVRGQVRLLKNKEFIDAARALGLNSRQILMRHILPNLLGLVIIYTSLTIPGIITFESIVSFLGVGVQEPNTSWGALISEGAATMRYGTFWQLFFPMTFFVAAQLAFYYIGDGLRDAFDPKDR